MNRPRISLDVIDVKTPCTASWEQMRGDDRVRFCKHCRLNVYNLSAMTREAAENLVNDREGHLCVQFIRRADGTLLTDDCENAWKRAARRAGVLATTAVSCVLAAALSPLLASGSSVPTTRNTGTGPSAIDRLISQVENFLGISRARGGIQHPNPPIAGGVAAMGDMAVPAPPPPPVMMLGEIATPAAQLRPND
jgi:hypothetical protein